MTYWTSSCYDRRVSNNSTNFGIQVIVLEETLQQNFEQELVGDVIQLMTVFSAKLYGKRSHQNRKKLAA